MFTMKVDNKTITRKL